MIWQLVSSGMASLKDLETTWSLDDAARAMAVLAIKSEVDRRMMEEVRKETAHG